jgi:hypothetical protein
MRFHSSLYLLILGFYLLTASGRIGRMSDSTAMFNVAQSIIREGSLSSEPCDPRSDTAELGPLCVPGRNGRFYSAYGVLSSVLIVPAILGARFISTMVHLDSLLLAKASASFFTLLVGPLSCIILAMWILKLGYGRRTALLAACILAFGSPFWQNSVSGFLSEPYFTLGLLVAAYLLSSDCSKWASALSGLAFGAACATRVAGIIMFPAFMLFMAFQIRARKLSWRCFVLDALKFSTPFCVCLALIGWTNYARFGSVLKTGYHIAFPTIAFTFCNPVFQGIRQLLFHGEIGLLIFAPWVILAVPCFPRFMRTHLPESILCGSMFALNLLFYAKYCQWHGGWAGGPRYLLPVLPFLIMVIVPTLEDFQWGLSEKISWRVLRVLEICLLTAGFVVQAVTLAYPRDRYYAQLMFYQHRPVKPWWYGSIPLASVDYWCRSPVWKAPNPEPEPGKTVAGVVPDAWAYADIADTEDQFMNLFPHPENLRLPELLVLKRRLMGLSAKAIQAYMLAVFVLIFTGAFGLKRYTVSQKPLTYMP